jgi:hypothetical protein
MQRTELERLDRDTLIARAEASGVVRARILTRPELIDELLQRAGAPELARARGFFGRARDLLARVIERGLHLPDAAERVRRSSPPPPVRPGAVLPTVTLAEIYAAQGHRERAIETLKDVLSREPDHLAARKLVDKLEDAAYTGPPPALPPEEEAPPAPAPPLASTAGEESAEGDECVAIPFDRETLFVHWRVSGATRQRLARERPGGALVLRALVISPAWDGPSTMLRDIEPGDEREDALLRGLPAGAVVRAAIGWRVGPALHPIAHSPSLEPDERDARGLVSSVLRWTPRGSAPVGPEDRDAGAIERALGVLRSRVPASGETEASLT